MSDSPPKSKAANLVLLNVAWAIIFAFYAFVPLFSKGRVQSALGWLKSSWNEENGYTHGWGIFPVVALLVWRNREKIRTAVVRPSNAGLLWILLGAGLFVLSARTIQPRIAIAGLPVLLYGVVVCIYGKAVARYFLFPLAMIYFAIPVPGLMQATNGLQLLVTKVAAKLSNLCGLGVDLSGNKILLRGGGDFHVDEGCSGIRSLTALMLIAFVYGYFYHKEMWKRLVIFAAALPIAIVTNILRIFSIVVVARCINETFAKTVYHDYSGFVSFGIGLGFLMLLSQILAKGRRWRKEEFVITRKQAGQAKSLERPLAVEEPTSLPVPTAPVGDSFWWIRPSPARFALASAACALGLGVVFLLPRSFAIQPSAMPGGLQQDKKWELPRLVYDWQSSRPLRPSEAEVNVLAADTKYAKRDYFRNSFGVDAESLRTGATFEQLSVFVVTSGSDMGNSIHRPERCLLAQGFNINQERKFVLQIEGRPMPVKKLACSRTIFDSSGKPLGLLHNVTYYWFVGHSAITNDHWNRTMLDLQDRIKEGYDQEWAYASVGLALSPHPLLISSKFDRFRDTLDREQEQGRLKPDESASLHALLDFLDAAALAPEEESTRIAEFLAAAPDKNKPPASENVKQLLTELKVDPRQDQRVMTRRIDDSTADSNGLTEADRLIQKFISDLARDVVDRRMIQKWNAKPSP